MITLRYILLKLLGHKDKETPSGSQKTDQITYKCKSIRWTSDFSKATLKQGNNRRAFQKRKQRKYEMWSLYAAKLQVPRLQKRSFK